MDFKARVDEIIWELTNHTSRFLIVPAEDEEELAKALKSLEEAGKHLNRLKYDTKFYYDQLRYWCDNYHKMRDKLRKSREELDELKSNKDEEEQW